MGLVGELLQSQIRKQMRQRTEDILEAVRRVEKSQRELTAAIERWIKFMEQVVEELKE